MRNYIATGLRVWAWSTVLLVIGTVVAVAFLQERTPLWIQVGVEHVADWIVANATARPVLWMMIAIPTYLLIAHIIIGERRRILPYGVVVLLATGFAVRLTMDWVWAEPMPSWVAACLEPLGLPLQAPEGWGRGVGIALLAGVGFAAMCVSSLVVGLLSIVNGLILGDLFDQEPDGGRVESTLM